MIQELTTEMPSTPAKSSMLDRSKLLAHYESLVHRLQAANSDAAVGQAIGITSCAPQAGVSTVAFNIAFAAERAGYGPVLLIDVDINKLPNPSATGKTPQAGLADALAGAVDPLDCVAQTPAGEFSMVSGRGMHPHNLSTIDRSRLAELLNEYKRQFKLLIVDIPAPSELNDSVQLAGLLDGVLLVIEAERADGRMALKTKQQLDDANANLLGVVLNKRQQHVPGWLYRRL